MDKTAPNRPRNLSLALAVLGSALLAGCADQSLRDEADANAALIRGEWGQAEVFAERAYRAYPSVTNEFNLATAYQSARQFAKASALYKTVVAEGNFIPTRPVLLADGSSDPDVLSPLSDEAARRLKLIGVQSALATQSAWQE